MKTAFVTSLIALWAILASTVPAGAAARQNRATARPPATATASFPLAACAFSGPIGGSCLFDEPYLPGGQTVGGRFSRGGFSAFRGRTEFARQFGESFTDRWHRMEHCLTQKPSFDWPRKNEAAWMWKQSHQEYPLPAEPNTEVILNSSQRSLANYQYCMRRR